MTAAEVVRGAARWAVIDGDCREVMAGMEAGSVHSVVCDPPYEYGFMGKKWDSTGVAFDPETWAACLRVLKPGGYLLAFGATRTSHRIACAIEDAGFEIRDALAWCFGSGFPKSLDVSKAIDKAAGAEREEKGWRDSPAGGIGLAANKQCPVCELWRFSPNPCRCPRDSGPATPDAARWSGWGTALKPAYEPVIVARKPLVGTVAANVLDHGTGGINVDGCRVGTSDNLNGGAYSEGGHPLSGESWRIGRAKGAFAQPSGRWPPNLLLAHHPDCAGTCHRDCAARKMAEQTGEVPAGIVVQRNGGGGKIFGSDSRRGAQPDAGYQDTGSAARFFPQFRVDDIDAPFLYTGKATRAERDAGLGAFAPVTAGQATDREDGSAGLESPRAGAGRRGGARNNHPTVKPVAVLRWLVRLVTPPEGIVLDPFSGSGSCGMAAMMEGEGRRYIGCELEPEYADMARHRIAHVVGGDVQRSTDGRKAEPARQVSLFGAAS